MFGFDRNTGIEEVALRDINHTAHTDGVREGGWVFSLVCIGSLVLFSIYPATWLTSFLKILFTLLIAAFGGLAVKFWISGASRRSKQTVEIEYQKMQRTLRDHQIEEANERGDFERWKKDE